MKIKCAFKRFLSRKPWSDPVNLRTPFKVYDDVSLLLCSLSRYMRKDVVSTDWMDYGHFLDKTYKEYSIF